MMLIMWLKSFYLLLLFEIIMFIWKLEIIVCKWSLYYDNYIQIYNMNHFFHFNNNNKLLYNYKINIINNII